MRSRMLFVILATLVFPYAAMAQWGTGLYGASQCRGGMQLAPGATSADDELNNLQTKINSEQQKIDLKNDRLDKLKDRLKRDRKDMRRVLSSGAVDAIVEHQRYNRNVLDYQRCSAASGSHGVNENLIPAPDSFCQQVGGRSQDLWRRYALNGGEMRAEVCDGEVGSSRGRPEPSSKAICREGLSEFYELMEQKTKLETEIAELDARCRKFERRRDSIPDEVAEGTYRPFCGSDCTGNGTSKSSIIQSLLPLASTLLSSSFGSNQGGPSGYNAGPGGYPGNPYPAPVPGYYNVNNGVYGAAPGAIGRGGFGCQGTSPGFIGNPYAAAPQPFLNGGGQNVFDNPFLNNLNNPAAQNALLLPGNGPGFMPILGNGINGYDPYAGNGLNPYSNLYQDPRFNNSNPFAPPTLPYLGQNSYFQNPYQLGGIQIANPYGNQNPYGPQYPAYMNGRGIPYGSGYGNPLGGSYNGNPYGSVYGAGAPPMGYYPPGYNGAAGYNGAGSGALGNFYVQMEQLKASIQVIQNSPIYGGSAPAYLPYPGPSTYSSPIYNTPGTYNNPLPSTPALPAGNMPNIIHAR